jgi:hypothetical protein
MMDCAQIYERQIYERRAELAETATMRSDGQTLPTA